MTATDEWIPCKTLAIGDTLKWKEPLWAAPTKPRGKRDKIGEQEVVARLTGKGDILEFTVISVTRLTGEAPLQVKENDNIRRRASSLKKGACQKRVS